MPPFGLYPIPTHHQNAQSPLMTRPIYNSLDFVDNEVAPVVAANDGSTDQPKGPLDDESNSRSEKEKRKEEKRMRRRERRDKKKQSLDTNSVQEVEKVATTLVTPVVNQTPMTSNSRTKKSIDGNMNSKLNDARSLSRKRKRKNESLDNTSMPGRQSASTNDFALGTDFLEGIKLIMEDVGAGFDRPSGSAQTNEPPSKKKSKLGQKSETTKNERNTTGKTTSDVVYTPTPAEGRNKIKIHKSNDGMNVKAVSTPSEKAASTMSPYISVPKKTPIPLPRNTHGNLQKVAPGGQAESQMFVAETSESQRSNREMTIAGQPIPFSILKYPSSTLSKCTESKQKPSFHPRSSPTPKIGGTKTLEPTPVVCPKNQVPTIKPSHQVSLTTSNLMRYTEPLNDEPKPRPRAASGAASTAASATSSVSSMSTKETFSRVTKPYTRSGAEIDPFVLPEVKKKIYRETHDEANHKVFVEKFYASRKTVNFTHEQEYLTAHISWRAQNDATGPLTCLGQATGCTPKREMVLRLHKEDTPNALKVLVTTDRDAHALADATERSTSAETFLQLAVKSRVPVPVGRVQGTWTLFCPKYSDAHVDKYGFGQRTLTIHSIPGFKDNNAYTARLSIPPRSMLYNILSFSVPPHASFRTTTLRTAVEGYRMDVLFLGNGYLQLRVDLNLLLRGKPTETAEGKPVYMEFLGVHEKAVKWSEERNELEEVGRRLFAKYDGVGGDD